MTGTVKFYSEEKGRGIIIQDMTQQEIPVHISALRGVVIKAGDRVEFELHFTPPKEHMTAVNIRVIK